MTPHDCATQGHRWCYELTPVFCLECKADAIDALLRRSLTDAVLFDGAEPVMDTYMRECGAETLVEELNFVRHKLITAILTAARETRHD